MQHLEKKTSKLYAIEISIYIMSFDHCEKLQEELHSQCLNRWEHEAFRIEGFARALEGDITKVETLKRVK
jgi:hypothetical protein